MLRRALILTFALLIAGCKLPPLMTRPVTQVDATAAARLAGTVEPTPRRVQADLDDIANGATIALIDVETGHTLGTTVSSTTGQFSMSFGKGFTPVDGRVYYLEAFKGLKGASGEYNQVGEDLARLRNIVIYQGGSWASLLNAAPGLSVNISRRTTALSTAIALKVQAGEALSYPGLMGALEPDPFVSTGGITAAMYTQIYDLVGKAIDEDRDPVQYIALDTNTGNFLNAHIGFSIGSIAPSEGNINTLLTIDGNGFASGSLTVAVNGVPATIQTVTDTRITARVAPGTRTGPVTVTLGNTLQAGPTFTVRFNDGHRAVLNDKLYAVNPAWNTLAEINASGEIKTLVDFGTGTSPQQVVVGPDNMLYVSLKDSGEIRRVNPANGGNTLFASLTAPCALAFDLNGQLYATSYQAAGAGSVTRFSPNGSVAEATIGGFDLPRGIAFDFTGKFYVSESSGVYQLTTSTANKAAATLTAAIPDPRGLAVDSAGDVYVASNANDVVYRIGTNGGVYSHLMTNNPSGISFDEKGSLYVSDSAANLIRRVSPLGDVSIFAYGISNPRGLAVDPQDGTLYVSLSQSNAVLKVENGVLKRFVTGIANPWSLKFRGNGLFVSHPSVDAVSYARRNGQMRTVASGVTFAGGADQAVDGAGEPTGPLYVGRFGDNESSATSLPPRFPGTYAITGGDNMGVDVVTGGVPTRRRFLHEQWTDFLAVDANKTIFAVRGGIRTLTRYAYTVPGSATNTSRQVRQLCGPIAGSQFEATPGYVALDAAGNVYVTVPTAGKIYRFVAASDYAKQEITGFNRPYAITFSDTGAMFVSDYGSGLLRRVTSPATATTPDGWTASLPTTARGITYLKTATPGTGTLFFADGASVRKYAIAGDVTSGAWTDHATGLPNSVSLLYCDASGNLYAYANATFAYKLSNATPPIRSNYIDQTGNGLLRSFARDPAGTLYVAQNNNNYLSTVNAMLTQREVELDQSVLYLASPDASLGGGVLRIDLATNLETMITGTGRAYSLALDTASPGRDLYVGGADGKVYKVVTDGTHTATWTLNTPVYGLDIRDTTLWGVGGDSVIYEMPIAGASQARRYGLMGPTF